VHASATAAALLAPSPRADALHAPWRPLRRLLTKTAEWSSAEERVRVAADCDARGAAYVPLALVMRGRENCSALRKGHLLHLARMWGYASHLWCAVSGQYAADGASI
jgi:hypothetical protein